MFRANRAGWAYVPILVALLLSSFSSTAQLSQPDDVKISRVDIKHAGPVSISEEIIRANIRARAGDNYRAVTVDDDIRSLFSTRHFYDVRVTRERAEDGGMILTYVVQANPRLTDININGNAKLKTSDIKKKITSKIGESLDERKLFTDSRAIEELYQKKGYPRTEVKATSSVDEANGRGTVTFEIKESPKIKIERVEFVGASKVEQDKLRKLLKGTRRHWMWSWLTRGGFFRDDKFEEDKERLTSFYRERGYIDFDIKDVEIVNPTPRSMIVRIHLFEGRQYKVGQVTFEGTTMIPTNAVSADFKPGRAPKDPTERARWQEAAVLNRGFKMKQGDTFTTKGLSQNTEAVENFYDARGHIDVARGGNLRARRIPNVETGTMDINYQVDEGQKSLVEKIEIRGNTKTKDKVIRRELALYPGETFDMTRVKISKRRLEGLDYFSKVEAEPEATDAPGRKNLLVTVEEQDTSKFSFGAGFSSIDQLVAYTEVTMGNFDLFHPPTFNGGGQKFRAAIQLGTKRQDYVLAWTEPWFMDRKLRLDTELYHKRANYQSVGNLYDEVRTGVRAGLSKSLPRPVVLEQLMGAGELIGSVYYNIENAGILLNDDLHGNILVPGGAPGGGPFGGVGTLSPQNVPSAILDENGYTILSKIGSSLAYDTRNDTRLPNGGQVTTASAEIASSYLGGKRDFYKLELESSWFFPGLAKGHVLELGARSGVVDGLDGDSVPFYERFYLGGLQSLRGFRYRGISPREFDPNSGTFFSEPVGGGSYWAAYGEYSIPVFDTEGGAGVRLAAFYDVGSVGEQAYNFNVSEYSSNWGLGIRLNIPRLGPLRIDYGIPIKHDEFNRGSGRIQFSVGWQRPF
jgi:outer membrane protein insertion porin family